jgi:hypothetical protein
MNAIVKHEQMNLDDLQRTAKLLALSGYFDAKGNGDQAIAQIATKILAGAELGYGPFAAVNGLHIIQGKPTISANLMAAAVKGHPKYDYRVRQMDDTAVIIEFFQGNQSLGSSAFTIEDARKAKTQNLDKFPRNMLFARAMSNGVRWFCPDVFSGNAVFTPEEIDGEVAAEPVQMRVVDTSTGEIVEHRNPGNGNGQHEPPVADIPAKVAEWLNQAKPADAAKAWAVECTAQPNDHAARNSLKKIVDADFGGKFNTNNAAQVLTAFYFRQQEHLNEEVEAVTVEEAEPQAF